MSTGDRRWRFTRMFHGPMIVRNILAVLGLAPLAFIFTFIFIVGAPLIAAGPAAAAEKVGSTQMCIMSNYIEETPVIDNRTILVRMNPGRGYKRIELET